MARRASTFALLFALVASFGIPARGASPLRPQNMSFVTVKRATSALAILLENGKTVRLIGLDGFPASGDSATSQAARAEATEFLNKMVAGKRIWMEYEPARADKLGNLLAYVFLLDNGVHVNAELIKRGYAVAFTNAYYKHRDQFEKLQTAAEKEKSGLWASYVPPPAKTPRPPAAQPVTTQAQSNATDDTELSFGTTEMKLGMYGPPGAAAKKTPETTTTKGKASTAKSGTSGQTKSSH
jgi:endonuclease YncB( thermonuclease family)